jgi:hypothetical protein
VVGQRAGKRLIKGFIRRQQYWLGEGEEEKQGIKTNERNKRYACADDKRKNRQETPQNLITSRRNSENSWRVLAEVRNGSVPLQGSSVAIGARNRQDMELEIQVVHELLVRGQSQESLGEETMDKTPT